MATIMHSDNRTSTASAKIIRACARATPVGVRMVTVQPASNMRVLLDTYSVLSVPSVRLSRSIPSDSALRDSGSGTS